MSLSSEDLGAEFEARRDGSADLPGEFESGQDSENLLGEFFVKQGSEDLPAEFESGQGSADLLAGFRGQTSVDLGAEFEARRDGSVDLSGEFESGQDSVNLAAAFKIVDSAELLGYFKGQDIEDLPAHFRTDKDFISKGLNVSVYRDMTIIA